MYYCLFIHSLVDGCFGCFQFLAMMNNVAVKTCVQVFVWTYTLIFFGRFLRMELLEHMVNLYLTYEETAKLFSKVVTTFLSTF